MRVSATIPAYNSARDIRRAIDSVLGQTCPVHELLVIDDGSTDNTGDVVRSYGGRVRYIHQANAGVSAARRLCVQEATGSWVAFLDADDWWLPDKIARQTEALEREPDAALAYTAVWWAEPHRPWQFQPAVSADRLWPGLRCRNAITTSSVMARRDALLEAGSFDPRLRYCEDWDVWVRLMLRRQRFVCVPDPLTVYSMTPGSLSSNVDRLLATTQEILESTLLDGLSGWKRAVWRRRIWSAQLHGAAVVAREAGLPRERELLWESVRHWPAPTFLPCRWLDLAHNLLGAERYGRLSNSWRALRQASGGSPAH